MNDPAQASEKATGVARTERVLAVKAAREDLNAAIKAAYSEAVERAWSQYEARLAEIWEAYEAAVARVNAYGAGVGGRQDERFTAALAPAPQIPEAGAPVIVTAKEYRSVAVVL